MKGVIANTAIQVVSTIPSPKLVVASMAFKDFVDVFVAIAKDFSDYNVVKLISYNF